MDYETLDKLKEELWKNTDWDCDDLSKFIEKVFMEGYSNGYTDGSYCGEDYLNS